MKDAQTIGSAAWNDEMYSRHRTPYGRTLAGFIQTKRIDRILAYAMIQPNERVLEIGCESGVLCAAIPPCKRLVGCDISAKALHDAESLLAGKRRRAEFVLHDALLPLPFQPGDFEVIICSEMLEHVSEPRAVVANIAQICNARTRVILTVPLEAPKLVLKRWLARLGLFQLFFPGIEAGQSEWHLQAFSARLLRKVTNESFQILRSSTVLGCHIVGLYQLISAGANSQKLK